MARALHNHPPLTMPPIWLLGAVLALTLLTSMLPGIRGMAMTSDPALMVLQSPTAVTTIQNKSVVYLIGGYTDELSNRCWALDLSMNFSLSGPLPATQLSQLPVAGRQWHALVVPDGSRIIVTGAAQNSPSPVQFLFEYDMVSDHWKSSVETPPLKFFMSAEMIATNAYPGPPKSFFFGGYATSNFSNSSNSLFSYETTGVTDLGAQDALTKRGFASMTRTGPSQWLLSGGDAAENSSEILLRDRTFYDAGASSPWSISVPQLQYARSSHFTILYTEPSNSRKYIFEIGGRGLALSDTPIEILELDSKNVYLGIITNPSDGPYAIWGWPPSAHVIGDQILFFGANYQLKANGDTFGRILWGMKVTPAESAGRYNFAWIQQYTAPSGMIPGKRADGSETPGSGSSSSLALPLGITGAVLGVLLIAGATFIHIRRRSIQAASKFVIEDSQPLNSVAVSTGAGPSNQLPPLPPPPSLPSYSPVHEHRVPSKMPEPQFVLPAATIAHPTPYADLEQTRPMHPLPPAPHRQEEALFLPTS